MKKKNVIRYNNRRTIKKSLPRFISLLVMAFLGMFVFVGLTSTAPDMIATLDKYLDDNNAYDIRLLSTMGFESSEVDLVNQYDGILKAYGSKSLDVIVREKESEPVIQISSLSDSINKVLLLDGRLPKSGDEILVESNYLSFEKAAIGDKIFVDDEHLFSKELTIVGVIDSPLYFNNASIIASRGNTNVGSGKVSYYAYCLEEAFDMDYYTCIYATVDKALSKITSYKEYLDIVDPVVESLEDNKDMLASSVYTRIHDEFQKELDDAKAEADEKLSDAKAELDDADRKLSDANVELEDAEKKLSDAKKKLDDYKIKLDDVKEELDSKSSEYQDALDSINAKEEDLYGMLCQIKSALEKITRVPGLEQTRAEMAYMRDQLELLIEAGEKIKEGREEYNSALKKYNDSVATYNENLTLYQSSKDEYDINLEKYHDALNEYEDKKAEADEKIADAQKDLDEMEYPEIYVYDRSDSSNYADYVDDSNTIRNLATIFPLVFFGVAVLISLISMSRLVDDDRLEIGTLKSLGFDNRHIISKYLSFALWATIVGSILGALSGQVVIPSLVNYIYKILFELPPLVITTQPVYLLIGFAITVICVCGSSIITAMRALSLKPSVLMRPKPPKAGHRILLENITFIWNRLNFSKKVTIRNLFRFKGKAFITIGGIAGCTALILTGFGIKDSIVDVPSTQYYEIFRFDGTALISEDGYKDDVLKDLLSLDGVEDATYAQRITANFDSVEGYIQIIEPDNLNKVAVFKDYYSSQEVSLEAGKAIINEKLADLQNIKVGDTIEIVDINHKSYKVQVSSIVTNLIEHFAYVSPETFKEIGGEYKPNLIYFNMGQEGFSKDNLVKQILDTDGIMSLSLREDQIKSIDDTLKSLDLVVWILIVLSALLAFVVLYNLSNINIVERKREIATLKVLGFYDKEVDDYIIKETLILSVIGILIGLVIGIFLSSSVVSTVEVEKCRFLNQIKPLSYIYASLITLLFSIIVSFITHYKLKKVNMIESLKSVE